MQHHGERSLGCVGPLEQERRVQRGCGQLLDDLLEPLVPFTHVGESFALRHDLLQQLAVDLVAGCWRHLSNCSGQRNQVVEGGRLVTCGGQVSEQRLHVWCESRS